MVVGLKLFVPLRGLERAWWALLAGIIPEGEPKDETKVRTFWRKRRSLSPETAMRSTGVIVPARVSD